MTEDKTHITIGGACPFCLAISGMPHSPGCLRYKNRNDFSEVKNFITQAEITASAAAASCEAAETEQNALSKQVGGSHYKNFTIQPIEFTTKNKLGFIQGSVIKRICRYNQPTGKGKEDLEKLIHEVQCLIEMEFPN